MDGEEQQGHKEDEIDKLLKIIDRSDKESDRLYRIYRILVGAITAITAVGIFMAGYVGYNSMKDMRSDLRDEFKTITMKSAQEMNDFKQKISEELLLLKNHLKSEQEAIVTDVGKKVNKRIEDEFNKDNIQTLVKSRAEERIDKIADSLIGQQIEKKITPKIEAANEKIINMDQKVAKATEKINNLSTETDFMTVFNSAQSNDRAAFEKLKIWSEDNDSPYRERASQAYRKIMEDHQLGLPLNPVDPPWKPGIDPSQLTFHQLREIYDGAGTHRPGVLKYVMQRKDITKKEKMQFLIDIIKSEQNLKFLEYAGQCFIGESKQNVYKIAYWEHIKWWDEHKDEIK